jgi:hypothetical protein
MPTIQTNCYAQILLYLCLSLTSLAQPAPVDSAASIPTARAAVFYQSYIGPDAAIYNGILYQQNDRVAEGDPWFISGNLTAGTLVYEDLTYTHIPMMYDLVRDQLVISDPKGQLITPPAARVQQFTFAGHVFVYGSVNNTTGYFEQLATGYASLFCRHSKKVEEILENGQFHRFITAHEQYYLLRQGRYYSVASEKQLITLLSDKKKELEQFRQANDTQHKKDPATAMQAIVDHYNQLLH